MVFAAVLSLKKKKSPHIRSGLEVGLVVLADQQHPSFFCKLLWYVQNIQESLDVWLLLSPPVSLFESMTATGTRSQLCWHGQSSTASDFSPIWQYWLQVSRMCLKKY